VTLAYTSRLGGRPARRRKKDLTIEITEMTEGRHGGKIGDPGSKLFSVAFSSVISVISVVKSYFAAAPVKIPDCWYYFAMARNDGRAHMHLQRVSRIIPFRVS
jgi:hypothetical protein